MAVSAADVRLSWGEGFREQHEAQAAKVSIASGGKSSVTLKLISSDGQK